MNYEQIIYNCIDGVAHIKLNRPDKLNALTERMIDELSHCLQEIRTDSNIRIVILSGEGRAFSAGVDLKSTKAEDFKAGGSFMVKGNDLPKLLNSMPQVMIGQIHGYCFTGALELALMMDMIYCARDTIFGDTHAKWSIVPRWGMTQRLSRRVGIAKAKELSFRAKSIDGLEAEKIGLANEAFYKKELAGKVLAICEEIKSNSQEAIALIKKLYNDGWSTNLEEGLKLEQSASLDTSNTDALLGGFEKKKGV